MEHLTSGLINDDFVEQFKKCIVETTNYENRVPELFLNNAGALAYEKYGLNRAASTEETDSWLEALVQIREHYGL